MSFNTPILTVFSWAKAGVASNPPIAMSAVVPSASVFFFIQFLQRLTPGRLSFRSLLQGSR